MDEGKIRDLEELARQINPKLRGWINYFSKGHKAPLRRLLYLVNQRL